MPRRGRWSVIHTDDEGERKMESERMELPDDLANGMVSTLLKNVRPEALPRSLSYVAATPKPRLVRLELATAPKDWFATGGRGRLAAHYIVKVDVGGLAGAHRAAHREAAARFARVDPRRHRAGVREGRADPVSRRSDLIASS